MVIQKAQLKSTEKTEIIIYDPFMAPNIRSKRSSTVQLMSLVESDDDFEWLGRVEEILGRKLKEPASAP